MLGKASWRGKLNPQVGDPSSKYKVGVCQIRQQSTLNFKRLQIIFQNSSYEISTKSVRASQAYPHLHYKCASKPSSPSPTCGATAQWAPCQACGRTFDVLFAFLWWPKMLNRCCCCCFACWPFIQLLESSVSNVFCFCFSQARRFIHPWRTKGRK